MTLVRRELVRIGLTVILDLLKASTEGDAVPASRIKLRAVRLELTFQNDLLKEHALQPDHRELVILAGLGEEFRFDDRGLVEIFVAIVVVKYREHIIHSDAGDE